MNSAGAAPVQLQTRSRGRPWLELVLVVLGPIIAIVAAWLLIAHTNWMTYDMWNVRRWPAVVESTRGTFVLHGLLFCSLCLVFINTVAYAFSGLKNGSSTVSLVYGVALVIIVLWGIEVYFGLFDWLKDSYPDTMAHLHDMCAIVVFVLFAIMDLMLYLRLRGLRLAGNVGGTAEGPTDRLDEELYLLQCLVVDLPVVCGTCFVSLFVHILLEHSQALGKGAESIGFLTGFGAGSLVMQIGLSQFVFLFIYLRYFRVRYLGAGTRRTKVVGGVR